MDEKDCQKHLCYIQGLQSGMETPQMGGLIFFDGNQLKMLKNHASLENKKSIKVFSIFTIIICDVYGVKIKYD